MTQYLNPALVLFVADVARATQFYTQLSPFRVQHQDAQHSVLALDGFELVLHALPPDAIEAPSTPLVVREDSYSKLCLPVARIDEARAIAARLGGAIAPPAKEWSARGFRACDGHDPEGNVIQVRERVADTEAGSS